MTLSHQAVGLFVEALTRTHYDSLVIVDDFEAVTAAIICSQYILPCEDVVQLTCRRLPVVPQVIYFSVRKVGKLVLTSTLLEQL
jgi:hypothetical protein